jgi:Ankyrin repeats (3 copies)
MAFIFLLISVEAIGCNTDTQRKTNVADSSNKVGKATARFHQIVEEGSLGELKAALEKGAPVNSPGHIGMTALMVAVQAEDVAKMKLLIEHGADAELTDEFNSTALMHAVQADFADGVRFLLSLGVDRGYEPKYPLKKIVYRDDLLPETPMPDELKSIMSESEWKQSQEETRNAMREMGETPSVRAVISEAYGLSVLKLLMDAGDDPNLASNEMKREWVGIKSGATFKATRNDFLNFRSPRFGKGNPEPMDNPFWQDMIRIGENAYSARSRFQDSEGGGPVWCYDRFGSSITPLPDGRFVQIAGEHEDYYDPDFYIYNDVVVHDGKGEFQIFGYPKDVFPRTDFHTATLVGNNIYIIGCLGYPDDRRDGFTPVYRLSLNSWEISPVATTGDMPGWIHGHRAKYLEEKNAIRIDRGELNIHRENGEQDLLPNKDVFELDLSTLTWHKQND